MRTPALALAALALLAAPAATADGGPSPGAITGWDGVLAAGAGFRYVALWAGPSTAVAVVRTHGGRVVRTGLVRGTYGIPLVAYDGTAGGLSADGKTLVLATFVGPPSAGSVSRFAVLATRTLRPRALVVLRGSYSFDAISPDGTTLYLIQYVSQRNWTSYRVRAYDITARKLLRGAIVDRREPGEAMQGFPVTRASTRDGGWAYTLYGRDRGKAFVHALDTRHRAAHCIDLPWKVGHGLGVRMRVVGTRLVLTKRPTGAPLGSVDTTTFAVSRA